MLFPFEVKKFGEYFYENEHNECRRYHLPNHEECRCGAERRHIHDVACERQRESGGIHERYARKQEKIPAVERRAYPHEKPYRNKPRHNDVDRGDLFVRISESFSEIRDEQGTYSDAKSGRQCLTENIFEETAAYTVAIRLKCENERRYSDTEKADIRLLDRLERI